MPRPQSIDTETKPEISARYDAAEAWVQRHLLSIAGLMALIGLLIRLHQAVTFYLNPDEAWQLLLAHPVADDSLLDLLKNSVKDVHPPLFLVALGLVERLGRQEWLLRLLPVIAGVAFPVFVMLWLRRLAGNTAGICAFAFLMFSPSLIGLSVEVRGYMPAFLLVSIAAWFLEAALERISLRRMAIFHAFLYAAILTEFCVVWIVGSLGVYALLRLWKNRAPLRLWAGWLGGQFAALGLLGILYAIQIQRPSYNVDLDFALNGYLSSFYLHPGGSVVLFLLRSTAGVFEYFGGNLAVAMVIGVLWIVGVVELWKVRSWIGVVLFVLPFCLGAAAAIIRVFPYGGSRHSAYLCLFLAAGAGIGIASLSIQRIVPALAVTLSLMLAGNIFEVTPYGNIPDARHRLKDLRVAIDYILTAVPPGSIVLTDSGTGFLLAYYLEWGDPSLPYPQPYEHRDVRGRRYIHAPGFHFMSNEELRAAIAETRKRYGSQSPLWVVAGGFMIRIDTPPEQVKPFTDLMTVFPVPADF